MRAPSGGRGNAARQQNIKARWDDATTWLSTKKHDVEETFGLESPEEANLGRADAFVGHGAYGPQEIQPSTGRGGFMAAYAPGHAGTEDVTMNTKVEFKDLITFSGSVATATEARWAPAATRINALPVADRPAAAANYMWTSAGKSGFLTNMQSRVQGAWSNQYSFHIDRPQWNWIGASVDVHIAVSEGTRGSGDHLAVKAYMMPPTEAMGTYRQPSYVGGGSGTNNQDQTGEFGVNDVNPRPDPVLNTRSVYFGNNDDALDATDTGYLDMFVRTFEGAPSDPRSHPTQVQVIGYASARGNERDNRALAQRRVDLIVDNNDDQVVIDHEFGHAFGLDDEYSVADSAGNAGWIHGTGGNAGTAVDHDAMVKQMRDAAGVNLPGAIAENNDSIMSLGNVVRPQHYAPFHEALRTISGVNEWALGASPTSRSAVESAITGASGPGDFPNPSGDTQIA